MGTTAATVRATRRRPAALVALIVMQLFLSVGALGGGAVLIASPRGGIIKLPLHDLDGSPFHDFLIPGIILFVVFGVGPVLVAWALAREARSAALERCNPFRLEFWGWTLSGVIGVGLVIWIAVEVQIIPSTFLQPFYAGVGVVIILLTLAPSVRAYYRRERPRAT